MIEQQLLTQEGYQVMKQPREVLFSQKGTVLTVTLNRPKQLNTLSLYMIHEIYNKLSTIDQGTRLVILKGEGSKAFCAGGDIKYIQEHAAQNSMADVLQVYKEEYKLDVLIHKMGMKALRNHSESPGMMAILDGITMGGGVGLSMGCNWRIGTEKLRWAMPETAIGFIPDVGSSYFLSRLPQNVGLYLGLTGQSINAAEALSLGIITHFVHTSDIDSMLGDIDAASGTGLDVATIVEKYVAPTPNGNDTLMKNIDVIESCFGESSVELIMHKLHLNGTDFAQKTLDTLFERAPQALLVTFHMLSLGKSLDMEDAFEMELRVCTRMSLLPDFREGVRAKLIDRDNQPRWSPAIIADVDQEMIAKLFSPFSNSSDELWG